jgi:hypothetical protein
VERRRRAVSWTWRYEGDDGAVVTVAGASGSESFPSQGDAETWIGEAWSELLEGGVTQVTLCDAGKRIYGPMSLRPTT